MTKPKTGGRKKGAPHVMTDKEAENESCAHIADLWAECCARNVPLYRPPRLEGDNYIADLHEQCGMMMKNLSKAIRARMD